MGCGEVGRVREGWGSAVRTVYALGVRDGWSDLEVFALNTD